MTEDRRAETTGEPVDVALLARQLAERGFYVVGELRCGQPARGRTPPVGQGSDALSKMIREAP